MDYVIISGHGRSGTNWLLDVLDFSDSTYCRNEPNALCGSAFARFWPGWLLNPDLPDLWDRTVELSATSLGNRDHAIENKKIFLRKYVRQLGLCRLHGSSRLRMALASLAGARGKEEWPVWPLVFDRRRLAQALTVFKINQSPALVSWVLGNRPDAGVIHIVRHPAGMINSWKNRYLGKAGLEQVAEDNRRRLVSIARHDTEWGERFGDIDAMSVCESEMWFWRYSTELVHLAGRGSPRYHLVLFEDMADHPDGVAEAVYSFCGLDYGDDVRRRVQESGASSRDIASSWRESMPESDLRTIEKVCAGSLVLDWWPDLAPGAA